MQRTLTSLLLVVAALLAPLGWQSVAACARSDAVASIDSIDSTASDAPSPCCGGACLCGDSCACGVERDDNGGEQTPETPAPPRNGRDRDGSVLAIALPASEPVAADAPPARLLTSAPGAGSHRLAGRALLARIGRWTT